MKESSVVLAGDIGGTKTNLGLYTKERGRLSVKSLKSYASRDAPHLEPIVEAFLSAHPATVSSACFGIAGRSWMEDAKPPTCPGRFLKRR
jgi:glucokinase